MLGFKNNMKSLFFLVSNRKEVFYYIFAIGFVAHGFAFFNECFSHDSVNFNIFAESIGLGRWGQSIFYYIRGKVVSPTLIGVLSLGILSLATVFLLDLYEIKKKWPVIVVCGTLVTSFVMTSITATYIFFLDVFMLAFLFSIVSLHILKYCKHFVQKIVFASMFLCLSLSLYQPYFQVFTLLCCLLVLFSCINRISFKKILNDILIYLLVIGLSLILYKLSVIISLKVSSINSLSLGYNSIKDVEKFQSVGQLLGLIIKSPIYLIEKIIQHPTYIGNTAKFLILIINFCIALYLIYRQTKTTKLRFFFSCFIFICAVPFFGNTVYVISKGYMDDTMMNSYIIVMFVPLLIAINTANYCELSIKSRNSLIAIVCFNLGILIFSNLVYSNQAYLKKELESKSSLTIASRILDRIESLPGFESNKTGVCFIGNANLNPYFKVERYNIGNDKNIVRGLGNFVSFTYDTNKYFRSIMGINLPYCDSKKIDIEYVQRMSLFPSADSVQMIDNQVLVKLGNTSTKKTTLGNSKNKLKSACKKSFMNCLQEIYNIY